MEKISLFLSAGDFHTAIKFDDNKRYMGDKEKKRRKSAGLGLAIWILAFLILVIVFLVKADDIKKNLEKARVFERLAGKTPSFLKSEDSKSDKKEILPEKTVLDFAEEEFSEKQKTESENQKKTENLKAEENIKLNSEEKKLDLRKDNQFEFKETEKQEPANHESSKNIKNDSDLSFQTAAAKEKKTDAASKTETQENRNYSAEKTGKKLGNELEKANFSKKPKNVESKTSNTIVSKICFVAIDSDGPVIRKEVSRSVLKDSPLTNSIISLLKGPTDLENSTGCRTLIPAGTRLYSASVKNGVATLDFSEEFEFNSYGVEGYLGQLMQIVYTATNYSTVDSVQILIEGQKKEYLGSEGVWIGSPLSRASFR